jgi:hypothetical protein
MSYISAKSCQPISILGFSWRDWGKQKTWSRILGPLAEKPILNLLQDRTLDRLSYITEHILGISANNQTTFFMNTCLECYHYRKLPCFICLNYKYSGMHLFLNSLVCVVSNLHIYINVNEFTVSFTNIYTHVCTDIYTHSYCREDICEESGHVFIEARATVRTPLFCFHGITALQYHAPACGHINQ